MSNKMLIDAAHPEETRVVVLRGNRIEEFDFESATRKPLRGNIYLAKVTRIEPSLQAAFIEYGGNRHGFLAFSEIHPDYYQIPVADRQALIEAEREEARARNGDRQDDPATDDEMADPGPDTTDARGPADNESAAQDDGSDGAHNDEEEGDDAEESVESVGAEDALEELPERRRSRPRQYKIQEVIRRRQVLLVQVVKEERGNKGAALTTYLSLAGRYSVLMPNTGRGGGISRKITSAADRKRLKEVASDLEVPEGMGVILRTAGASRTKAEIKRDFEYLLRLWENVRELTLRSTAPTLVYEEGSLIKRSIRDLYSRDVGEILVAGEDGYREAKDFMRMLMPSHAKNVQPYRESQPLFAAHAVEGQLDAMFSPQVSLPAGGYIVLDQTEALVSIDVNSGRSTREHSIEDTAVQTNLEASDEIARQLRLRDLAGLVVIDFIDMEERRNNRAVERRIKDCLKDDRARIQVGRISHFGLLEMSRQRIRTSVLESTSEVCPHCLGSGHVRSAASVALHVLRSLEDHLLKGVTHDLNVRTRTNVALYILNQKRSHISELEQRFGLFINIIADETVNVASHFALERGEPIGSRPARLISIQPTSVQPEHDPDEDDAQAITADAPEVDAQDGDEKPSDGQERKRKRRRRRKRPEAAPAVETANDVGSVEQAADEIVDEIVVDTSVNADEVEATEEKPRRRRRGRRGGRRTRRGPASADGAVEAVEGETSTIDTAADAAYEIAGQLAETPTNVQTEEADAAPSEPDAIVGEPTEAPAPKPKRRRRPKAEAKAVEADSLKAEAQVTSPDTEDVPLADVADAENHTEDEQQQPKERRGGWWQRRSFF
ncbi:MAG: Rne/Rng family ribonuclease [Alphaproteobacteria bacterium]